MLENDRNEIRHIYQNGKYFKFVKLNKMENRSTKHKPSRSMQNILRMQNLKVIIPEELDKHDYGYCQKSRVSQPESMRSTRPATTQNSQTATPRLNPVLGKVLSQCSFSHKRLRKYPLKSNETSILNNSRSYSMSQLNISINTQNQSILHNESLCTSIDYRHKQAIGIGFPMTGVDALLTHKKTLCKYEREEILAYGEVHYIGGEKRIRAEQQDHSAYNDKSGFYKLIKGDHLGYRFEVLSLLGKGQFGHVVKCFDHREKEEVAVKVIRSQQQCYKQGIIEVKLLGQLNKFKSDEGVLEMKTYFAFRGHLCIVFELLSVNLKEFMDLSRPAGISLGLVKRFALQILVQLKYHQKLGVIHCDLKPENILLKQPNRSAIKIIDYGSACLDNKKLRTYIQSREYRAPEILLRLPYSYGVDMWSLGCVLLELAIGQPLFSSQNEHEQLEEIIKVIGMPPDCMIECSPESVKYFYHNRFIPATNAPLNPMSRKLSLILRDCPDRAFVDFIQNLIRWDPETRMNPVQALHHHWLDNRSSPKLNKTASDGHLCAYRRNRN